MKFEKLLQHVLTFLPPIAAVSGAWIVHAKFHPFTFNSEAAFGALCFAFVISAIFSTRLVFISREDKARSSWIAGLDTVVIPFVALEVAVGALAVGWLVGSIVALCEFWGNGATPIQLVLPAICASTGLVLGRIQKRPSPIQRIWQLADARNGLPKLQAICRTARETDDLTTLHAIAKMPRMDPGLLELLATHADFEIRADVANNPNTPAADLLKLSHDPSINVRRAVAFNPAAGVDILRMLAKETDEIVREKAKSRMRELEVTP